MSAPHSILIVEDEAIVAVDLEGRVKQMGYQVAGRVATGEEAVVLASDLRPALVLMDIHLAGAMDGFTAARAIHKTCDLPVVFLTADDDENTLARAHQAGAFGYMRKPFDERDLRIQLEMALLKHAAALHQREKEERLAGIVNSAMDAIISVDESQHIQLFNPAAEWMFGITADEALGQPLERLIPERFRRNHAAHIHAFAERGVTARRMGELGEVSGRRADGTEFPIEASISQVRTERGNIYTVILRDITARKQSEGSLRSSRLAALNLMEDAVVAREAAEQANLALRASEAAQLQMNADLERRVAARTQALQTVNTALSQSEEKFRTWAEQSPSLILVYFQNHVVYANRMSETLLGYTPGELCAPGFTLEDLMVSKSVSTLKSLIRQFVPNAGAGVTPTELTLRTKRGDRVEVILATRPIAYAEGQARLCILTDITARKRAERLSKIQQKRLRQLASKVATAQDDEQRRIGEGLHDDVAQILAACSIKLVLVRREANPADRDKLFDEIDGMLREADEKIHSLSFELGASTLHQGGLENALRELCDRMATRYGIQFRLRREGTAHPLAQGTATVLFKAARELLFNVVKHAEVRQASITLQWRREETRIMVIDHGKGFRRLDPNDLSNNSKGLGLFAVRERLRDLGGDLRIDNAQTGKTCVMVRVPRMKAKESIR